MLDNFIKSGSLVVWVEDVDNVYVVVRFLSKNICVITKLRETEKVYAKTKPTDVSLLRLATFKEIESHLLACPFCGCESMGIGLHDDGISISCDDCVASIGEVETIEKAVFKWNTRFNV